MPKFNTSVEMDSHTIGGTNFQFSGARVQDVSAQSSAFTLATLVVDVSGSVFHFQSELDQCIKDIVHDLQRHPRANNLLVRLVLFNSRVAEVHGFLPLSQINLADYDGIVQPGGTTKLYDACVDSIKAACEYGNLHYDADNDVNAIVVVVTDGLDYGSTLVMSSVGDAIRDAHTNESLESLLAILVGVNDGDQAIKDGLDAFTKEAGFDQYVPVSDTKSFGKVAGFVSQSVSSQSQALNTGGPSQVIPPTSLGL